MDELKQLAEGLLLWLCLAIPGLAFLGWWWWRGWDWRDLLPPQRNRAVPWLGVEVLAAFGLFLIWLDLGNTVVAMLLGTWDREALKPYSFAVQAVVAPFQVASVVLLMERISGTRPYQLGLTTRRLGRNLLLGYLSFVVLPLLVYVVNYLTDTVYTYRTGERPESHPVVQLFESSEQPPWMWVCLFFSTVMAAPWIEEFLFRGVLLFWLPTRPWGSQAVLLGTVVLTFLKWRAGENAGLCLFAIAMVPGFYLLPQLLPGWKLDQAQALYATSVLFAAVHPWPTPIALFVLGLGLGWLAYRTRSLVGPMTMHALFNLLAFLELWRGSTNAL